MKRILYTLLFVATVLTVNAQDNKWNIGFGGGFASPQGDLKDIASGGVDGYLNCTYNFTSKLAAGLEYNSSTMVGASFGDMGTNIDFKATKISAILLKGVYYMTETKVRPYAAVMTGMYMTKIGVIATDGLGNDISEYVSKSKLGGGLELGLKIKWFNLGVGYHNLGKVEGGKVSYMQYNLGFNIGF
ncbi:MAG TPA: hypothetical protein VMW01_01885 [Williamwhitmania sp.]|jgi:hypothetical protein|nr:hypothetical protein [Williamwhitmania sp.]